jgi:conjugal transfer pilus assembly protein TraW
MKKFFFMLVAFLSVPALAKDFGIRAHTYKIIEQPFLQMIDDRLQKVDIEEERKKMVEKAKDRIHNPQAVKDISPATKSITFYHDPTYTLDEDIVLHCGKILHKAGTKVNPLEHMQLNRRMFFVDSRKHEQVKWLKAQLNNPLPQQLEVVEDKIILIGGNPFKLKDELGKEHENKVYFDQAGALTTRFGIKASPAVVVQEDLRLKIDEVLLND